jgi:hypothetical protein
MDFTFDITYQQPRVWDMPSGVGEVVAAVAEQLPTPILTVDEVKQMQVSNEAIGIRH